MFAFFFLSSNQVKQDTFRMVTSKFTAGWKLHLWRRNWMFLDCWSCVNLQAVNITI